VLHVRRHGYKAKFGRYVYRYLDWPSPDGTVYQYWTMGMPIYMTHILNRAVKKTPVVAPVEPFEPFEPFEAFSFDTR
jgi:hypothetical protein